MPYDRVTAPKPHVAPTELTLQSISDDFVQSENHNRLCSSLQRYFTQFIKKTVQIPNLGESELLPSHSEHAAKFSHISAEFNLLSKAYKLLHGALHGNQLTVFDALSNENEHLVNSLGYADDFRTYLVERLYPQIGGYDTEYGFLGNLFNASILDKYYDEDIKKITEINHSQQSLQERFQEIIQLIGTRDYPIEEQKELLKHAAESYPDDCRDTLPRPENGITQKEYNLFLEKINRSLSDAFESLSYDISDKHSLSELTDNYTSQFEQATDAQNSLQSSHIYDLDSPEDRTKIARYFNLSLFYLSPYESDDEQKDLNRTQPQTPHL